MPTVHRHGHHTQRHTGGSSPFDSISMVWLFVYAPPLGVSDARTSRNSAVQAVTNITNSKGIGGGSWLRKSEAEYMARNQRRYVLKN